jgi:mevalonate kinase
MSKAFKQYKAVEAKINEVNRVLTELEHAKEVLLNQLVRYRQDALSQLNVTHPQVDEALARARKLIED